MELSYIREVSLSKGWSLRQVGMELSYKGGESR